MTAAEFFEVAAPVAAAAWPLTARAEQHAMPVIGYLSSGSQESDVLRLTQFRKGLSETGYIEGQNVAVTSAGKLTLGPAIFPEQD
jgi:hypothetical protein